MARPSAAPKRWNRASDASSVGAAGSNQWTRDSSSYANIRDFDLFSTASTLAAFASSSSTSNTLAAFVFVVRRLRRRRRTSRGRGWKNSFVTPPSSMPSSATPSETKRTRSGFHVRGGTRGEGVERILRESFAIHHDLQERRVRASERRVVREPPGARRARGWRASRGASEGSPRPVDATLRLGSEREGEPTERIQRPGTKVRRKKRRTRDGNGTRRRRFFVRENLVVVVSPSPSSPSSPSSPYSSPSSPPRRRDAAPRERRLVHARVPNPRHVLGTKVQTIAERRAVEGARRDDEFASRLDRERVRRVKRRQRARRVRRVPEPQNLRRVLPSGSTPS